MNIYNQFYTLQIYLIESGFAILIIIFLLSNINTASINAGVFEPLVQIKNISTIPGMIHIGDAFDLKIEIVNLHQFDVQILSFGCNGPANVFFNNNIKVIPLIGTCTNTDPVINFIYNETKTLIVPDVSQYFIASQPGIVNGTIQMEYYKGQYNISKFDIDDISQKYISFISVPFSFMVSP